jgi:hypothetical protein
VAPDEAPDEVEDRPGRRRLAGPAPAGDALAWLAGDLPLPRQSLARPGGRRRLGEPADEDPEPPQPPRHRRADIF